MARNQRSPVPRVPWHRLCVRLNFYPAASLMQLETPSTKPESTHTHSLTLGPQPSLSRRMSATNTTTVYLTGQTVPSDYALYRSPARAEDGDASVPEPELDLQSALGPTANPPDWQDQWRRVPSYRPRRNQAGPERDTGRTAMEARIIHFFFGGAYWANTTTDPEQRIG